MEERYVGGHRFAVKIEAYRALLISSMCSYAGLLQSLQHLEAAMSVDIARAH